MLSVMLESLTESFGNSWPLLRPNRLNSRGQDISATYILRECILITQSVYDSVKLGTCQLDGLAMDQMPYEWANAQDCRQARSRDGCFLLRLPRLISIRASNSHSHAVEGDTGSLHLEFGSLPACHLF